MYFDPGGEGGVVDGDMPFERPGPCSAIGGGGMSEASSPGVMVETKVHAGVVAGRKRVWVGPVRRFP